MLAGETDANCYTHARLAYHTTVRELPSEERPRGRLEHFGPQALSLAEQTSAAVKPHWGSLPKGAHLRVILPGRGKVQGKKRRKRGGRTR